MSFILELIGSFIVIILGFLGLIRILWGRKEKKKIWGSYRDLSDDAELELREGSGMSYSLPDLYGEMEGRKVYVHPGKGNKKKRPKTTYAVETKIPMDGSIIISSPETSEVEEGHPSIDVPNIEKYDLAVNTESIENESIVKNLLSKKVSSKINHLASANKDDFRGLVLEPGLAMFSNFGIKRDIEKIKDTIGDVVELVDEMEKSSSEIKDSLQNERLRKFSEKSKTVYLELSIMSAVLAFSIYLTYTSLMDMLNPSADFSIFFLNLGIVTMLISGSRLFSLASLRDWL